MSEGSKGGDDDVTVIDEDTEDMDNYRCKHYRRKCQFVVSILTNTNTRVAGLGLVSQSPNKICPVLVHYHSLEI